MISSSPASFNPRASASVPRRRNASRAPIRASRNSWRSLSALYGFLRYSTTVSSTPGVSSRIASVLREVPHAGLCQMVAFIGTPPNAALQQRKRAIHGIYGTSSRLKGNHQLAFRGTNTIYAKSRDRHREAYVGGWVKGMDL